MDGTSVRQQRETAERGEDERRGLGSLVPNFSKVGHFVPLSVKMNEAGRFSSG
jgi:hypothetical protein